MSPENSGSRASKEPVELLIRELFKYVHTALPKERAMFSRVLGDTAAGYLASIGVTLNVFNANSFVKTSDTRAGSVSILDKLGMRQPHYIRTDYVAVMDEHLVAINTWESISSSSGVPAHATQIDFLYLADWVHDTPDRYITHHASTNLPGAGLYTEGMHFMRHMKDLINSIDHAHCIMQVPSQDAHHYQIYRKALSKVENIRYGRS